MDKFINKILIIRRYGGYGGIEHQIENISFGLITKGWQVHLLTDAASPLTESLADGGVQVSIAPFSSMLVIAREICNICKKHDISIVQSHMLRESFYCRMAKLLRPSLVHIFRVHTFIDCSHIPQWKKNCYHAISWLTDFLVNHYVSINEFNVRELRGRTHIPARKITVVHNAVRPLKECERAVHHKNGKIAMIANFVDFKGHDVLLDGLKLLKDRGHRFEAHLIGSVPGFGTPKEDRRRLDIVEQTIREYGLQDQVVMVGYQSDIAKAVSDCGMVVLPSDSEGTPNVLLEGILLDRIVIASSVGGVPEFVIEGKTGFLHAPKDAQEFAAALLRAYEMPELELEQIACAAKALLLKEYSIKSLVDQIQSVYTEVGGLQ